MSAGNITTTVLVSEEDLEESYKKLKKNYAELEEVDKIKTDFVSYVTHELRTPLAIVRNNLEMFLDGTFGDLNDMQKQSLGMIFKNIERLILLVQDSLDMSRIYGGRLKLKYEKISLEKLFGKIISDMEIIAEEKGHELSLDIKGDIPLINCDLAKITQVLTNLLQNAIKFTPNGGKICVTVERGDIGNSVQVEVSDNGIGIPKEEHENVFKQFYEVDTNLHKETSGTGLGLSIVKGIVEAHGGKIWVESEPGVGSSFIFTMGGSDNE